MIHLKDWTTVLEIRLDFPDFARMSKERKYEEIQSDGFPRACLSLQDSELSFDGFGFDGLESWSERQNAFVASLEVIYDHTTQQTARNTARNTSHHPGCHAGVQAGGQTPSPMNCRHPLQCAR